MRLAQPAIDSIQRTLLGKSIMRVRPVDMARRASAPLGSTATVWLAAAMLLFSGCAFTTGHVDLAYQPTTQATKLATPQSPRVTVVVTDRRPTQAVGQKINGFGMKTADIVSDTDVPKTLKNAFETELNSRGFSEGAGGNVVSVSLNNFENQFTLGFFSGDSTATIGMQVTVKRPDGSVAYDQYVTGQSKDWVEIAREGNAERQLNAAMQDGVSKVFSDDAFIASLTKS
jgi:uncharacterized lipoprotein YajG